LEELQTDMDKWLGHYNEERKDSGRYCFGKIPTQTFRDSIHLAKEKQLDRPYDIRNPINHSSCVSPDNNNFEANASPERSKVFSEKASIHFSLANSE
jgi:hypothetical protein